MIIPLQSNQSKTLLEWNGNACHEIKTVCDSKNTVAMHTNEYIQIAKFAHDEQSSFYWISMYVSLCNYARQDCVTHP